MHAKGSARGPLEGDVGAAGLPGGEQRVGPGDGLAVVPVGRPALGLNHGAGAEEERLVGAEPQHGRHEPRRAEVAHEHRVRAGVQRRLQRRGGVLRRVPSAAGRVDDAPLDGAERWGGGRDGEDGARRAVPVGQQAAQGDKRACQQQEGSLRGGPGAGVRLAGVAPRWSVWGAAAAVAAA